MKDKILLIFLIFFVFVIFLFNNLNISGNVVDVNRNIVVGDHRFCLDSDNGIKPYTPGYVQSDIGTFNDICFDNLRQIREYYCDKGRFFGNYKVSSKVVSCGTGFKCVRNSLMNADSCMKG